MERQRCCLRYSGFSLVELLLVVAVIAILIGIATLAFSKMILKASIERQMNMLYSDIMEIRTKALYQKLPQTIKLTPHQLSIYSGISTTSSPTFIRAFQHPIGWSSNKTVVVIEYDTFGITNDLVTVCVDPTQMNSASIDSLVISNTRVRLGKRRSNRPCDPEYVKLQ